MEAVEDAEREPQRDSRKVLVGRGVGEHRTEGRECVVEEPLFDLHESLVQRGIGARRDDELQPGRERVAEAMLVQEPHRGRRRALIGGKLCEGLFELSDASREQVLERREHQVLLGREVVHLRPPRNPCATHDLGRAGARPAQLDQALDRRVEQTGLCCGTSLGVPRSPYILG